MTIDELRGLFAEVIEAYEEAEDSRIHDRSTDFKKDREELRAKVADWRSRFDLMLGQSSRIILDPDEVASALTDAILRNHEVVSHIRSICRT